MKLTSILLKLGFLHAQSWQQRQGGRGKEVKDYRQSEAELVDVAGTLERAFSIIQREMSRNLVFVQKKIETRNIIVISVPTAVIDAVVFSSEDKQKSVALVRARQASDDDDSEISVLSAAASVSHSSDIVDLMCCEGRGTSSLWRTGGLRTRRFW